MCGPSSGQLQRDPCQPGMTEAEQRGPPGNVGFPQPGRASRNFSQALMTFSNSLNKSSPQKWGGGELSPHVTMVHLVLASARPG